MSLLNDFKHTDCTIAHDAVFALSNLEKSQNRILVNYSLQLPVLATKVIVTALNNATFGADEAAGS